MTAPYYEDEQVTVYQGDCLEVLRSLPDNSIDSVTTDPPYGLEFMGKTWDAPWKAEGAHWRSASRLPGSHSTNPTPRPQNFGTAGLPFQQWCEQWAAECLRVLKPGGHMLAFGGTRTWHRLACAVEDAGFEVRDSVAWLYGSGFPKSLDVSKAIDAQLARAAAPTAQHVVDAGRVAAWLREQCAARGVGSRQINEHFAAANVAMRWLLTAPTATKRPQVPKWDQWAELRRWLDLPDDMDAEVWRLNGMKGTPAPLAFVRDVIGVQRGALRDWSMDGARQSVDRDITAPATPAAQQWQGWGTALKPAFEPIVVARKPLAGTVAANVLAHGTGAINVDSCRVATTDSLGGGANKGMTSDTRHEGFARPWMDDEKAREAAAARSRDNTARAESLGRWPTNVVLSDDAAAELDEQSGNRPGNKGLTGTHGGGRSGGVMGEHKERTYDFAGYGDSGGASRFFPVFRYQAKAPTRERPSYVDANGTKQAHATVKPLALMRWLVRLVTPPDGIVLDPFAGSGTTIEAAILEGFRVIGIEREADYLPLIDARIQRQLSSPPVVRPDVADALALFDFEEPA